MGVVEHACNSSYLEAGGRGMTGARFVVRLGYTVRSEKRTGEGQGG